MWTLLWTCRTSRLGMLSPSPSTSPLQLKRTGNCMAPKSTVWNRLARASPAGAMREVWKGPLTFRGITRLAPASLARRPASSTAAASPPMTICPGQFRLAISATPRREAASQHFWRVARSSISTAAMALGRSCTAPAMAFPRKATRSMAVTGSKTPAAHRAEYSPRLSPAAMAGRTPFS